MINKYQYISRPWYPHIIGLSYTNNSTGICKTGYRSNLDFYTFPGFLMWGSGSFLRHPSPTLSWATQQSCPYKQTSLRLAAGHRLGNSESGRSRSLPFFFFFFLSVSLWRACSDGTRVLEASTMLPAECLFHFLNKKCKCSAPALPSSAFPLQSPAVIPRFERA